MYDSFTFQVSINNSVSMKGSISRGVRQGGVMCIVVLDELLYELVDSNCGAAVCSIACGNPVLCDDLIVPTKLPRLLQLILDISHGFSLN